MLRNECEPVGGSGCSPCAPGSVSAEMISLENEISATFELANRLRERLSDILCQERPEVPMAKTADSEPDSNLASGIRQQARSIGETAHLLSDILSRISL